MRRRNSARAGIVGPKHRRKRIDCDNACENEGIRFSYLSDVFLGLPPGRYCAFMRRSLNRRRHHSLALLFL
jgi:hypothetical protein